MLHCADILKRTGEKIWGYRYTKIYPNEELRNCLVELGIPRNRHNLAELGELLPTTVWTIPGEPSEGGRDYYCWLVSTITGFNSRTEADARTTMLIYLIENHLLDLRDRAA